MCYTHTHMNTFCFLYYTIWNCSHFRVPITNFHWSGAFRTGEPFFERERHSQSADPALQWPTFGPGTNKALLASAMGAERHTPTLLWCVRAPTLQVRHAFHQGNWLGKNWLVRELCDQAELLAFHQRKLHKFVFYFWHTLQVVLVASFFTHIHCVCVRAALRRQPPSL